LVRYRKVVFIAAKFGQVSKTLLDAMVFDIGCNCAGLSQPGATIPNGGSK